MAHFAVVAPPLPGHFNPLLVLADRLVARGHEVTFVNQAEAAPLVTRPGIGFEPVGLGSHPPGALAERMERMARLRGPFGRGRLIRDVASLTDMLCRELPGTLRGIGADAVIADQMEAAGGLVAEHLGLPFVSVAAALPINREPGVPPPYLGWGYDGSASGLRRNRGGWRVTDWLMRPVAKVIAGHAARFGLSPRERAEDCLSPILQIAQAVRGIDFPRAELPRHFHYLGPFRADGAEDCALPGEDGRPLAFCSFGSLQGGRAGLFRRVASACDARGLQPVIAHGGRLSEQEVEAFPGSAIIRDLVPQRALLARSAVAVSHCGFNTVMDGLSFGVPILALPIAFEQPAIAARLVHAGVGRRAPLRAGRRRMERELAMLVGDEGYRASAKRVAAEIAAAGGVRQAVRLIEAMPGLPARPAAATKVCGEPGDARDDSRNGSS